MPLLSAQEFRAYVLFRRDAKAAKVRPTRRGPVKVPGRAVKVRHWLAAAPGVRKRYRKLVKPPAEMQAVR